LHLPTILHMAKTFSVAFAVFLPHALALVTDPGRITKTSQLDDIPICAGHEKRQFELRDSFCGNTTYDLGDCMKAFADEQAYWSQQGSSNPWWAVLTNQPKGVDIPLEAKLDFYKSGLRAVQIMEQQLGTHDIKPVWAGRALDLGCGLGRMSNALSTLGFQEVFCVDQAKTFLIEAQRSLSELEGQGVVPKGVSSTIKFLHSDPDLSCQVQPGTVDFVHSVITLQHMVPQLQVAYMEQMCDALRPNGIGYFGIPTDIIGGHDKSKHCSLANEENRMRMHYTEEREIVRHLSNRGCSVEGIEDRADGGNGIVSRGFIFRKG